MDIQNKQDVVPEGTDPLLGALMRAKTFVKNNGSAVMLCGAVIIVAVVAVLIFNGTREANNRAAQEFFGIGVLDYTSDDMANALERFKEGATRHPNTPAGAMSAFMAGSILLQNGDAAQAITWFEQAIRGGQNGFVRGSAHEGIAVAHEINGNIGMAAHHLEQALRDRNIAHRHAAIRWRLALIKKDTDVSAASAICREIMADTLATFYHQRAENLLAIMNIK